MDELARLREAIARAGEELRARMGGGRPKQRKKKPRMRPGRPARNGKKSGCGTGDGGFGVGNNCAKEDGVPDRPKSFAQGGALKMPNVKKLKKEVAQEKAAAAAAAAKQKAREIAQKKKSALSRKEAKAKKSAEEQKKAAEASAAKKKAMLQKIRVKKANEQVSVVGTPKSVAEQLAEAKTAMKQKTAEASKQLTVSGTPKSVKEQIEEIKAAEAKAKAVEEAKKNAAEEAAAKQKALAEAQAKTTELGKPAPVKRVDSEYEKALAAVENPPSTPPPSALKIEKTLGGSTGAQLAADSQGNRFVIKSGKTKGHIENESQADDLYRAAGADVPRQQLHTDADGTSKKVAEFVAGKTLADLKATDAKKYDAAVAKLKKHFVADALFANYDVVGMNLDNIVVGKGGKVFRVDNGGSLTYRAQGKQKDFGAEVAEIDSLRNSSVNAASAGVFGSITNKEISSQITSLLKRKEQILAAAKTEDLRQSLSKRLDSLQQWQKNYKKLSKIKVAAPQSYVAANGAGLEKAIESLKSSSNVKPDVVQAVSTGRTSSLMTEDDRHAAASAVWTHSLTSFEKSAVRKWGENGFIDILGIEKKGPAAVAGSDLAKRFRKGVEKLPKYSGTITRRLDSIKGDQIKSWLKTGRWTTEHPSAPGNPTHASFSTIDKATDLEQSIKNGSMSPGKGSVVVVIRNSTRAADTGRLLTHSHEKEVILPPSGSEAHKVIDHYWIVDKNHPAVKAGKYKQGDRASDSSLSSAMGGSWDQTQQSNATFVLIVDEDHSVAVGKAKPKKKG